MKTITRTTSASGHEYSVSIQTFESLDEARKVWKDKGFNPDEVLLGILNAAQAQNAMQGPKGAILTAIGEAKKALGAKAEPAAIRAHEDVSKAIAAAQDATSKYIIGAPRGAQSGGVSRKKERETLDTLRQATTVSDEDIVRQLIALGVPVPPALSKVADKVRKEDAAK